MQRSRLRTALLGGAAALLTAGVLGTAIRKRRTARHVRGLRRSAATGRDRTFATDDLAGLPEPVREYFATVLRDGQPHVDAVRLEQAGTLRAGDASSPWKPFTATQYVTVDPPGFLWDAAVDIAPLVSLRVRDSYREGDGSASVSLGGVVPIDGADPSPELNEGELLRYLAEAVWYPTALLPSEGVEWDAVDGSTANATVEYGGASATLTFAFDDGEVTEVHATDRPRRVDGGYEPTPWTGRWTDYETRDGMRVPTRGEVVWHLPDGDLTAWRGRLMDSSYDPW
ncbi:DUF6544 family protein [Haloarcula salina]|uniref:Uncharacterized protein n=1 Tax=Haloarcula salina TaxID=1429914 RepID=A0AA41G1V1_9EURY|nr:DUF6544 family protein [Haloarcula salina]MBV0902852.1 hypothetical protein [Haloarcula salina]